MASTDVTSIFWNDPLAALSSIFGSPAGAVTGAPSGLAGNGLEDSASSARERAYGVDPATGKLIAPQYFGVATAAGYDPNNPGAFKNLIDAQVTAEYNADNQKFLAQLPLFPSVTIPGLESLGSFDWKTVAIAFVVLIVLLFVIAKAV